MDIKDVPQGLISLEDAVEHFGEHFRAPDVMAREKQPHIELLHAFCAVTVPSVMRWYRDKQYPVGEGRVRLLCLLEAVGYNVIEFQELAKPAQQLCRLISFGVIGSVAKAQRAMGYRNPQSLYRVLLRGEGLSGDRVRRLNELIRTESQELPERQRDWRERFTTALGIEPRFVTIDEVDLPAPPIPLARGARGHNPPSQATPTPAYPRRTTTNPRPPQSVNVPTELILDATVASIRQLMALVGTVRESSSPDELARALRKSLGGELSEVIATLEGLVVELQFLE